VKRTRRQRVFVTGATGFVGSFLVRQLLADGRDVAILLRPASDTWRIIDVLDRINVVAGSMENVAGFAPQLAEFAPEAVAHLAWRGVTNVHRNDAVQALNVTESVTLYTHARDSGCTRFVGMGSQAEYGPVSARLDEQVPTRPTTVYGAAKLSAALLLDRLAVADGVAFAWLRLFSSYGPKDDPSWLIPYMARRLLAGERPALTAGEQIWDYIYVEDVAAAVLAALDVDATGFFNLGSGVGQPLRAIIEAVRDAIDPALPLGIGEVPYRSDQVMHLEADITALTTATGWVPRMPLNEGLANTIAWLRTV
jgi:nucleoside-diphosphate-sugar epimerase